MGHSEPQDRHFRFQLGAFQLEIGCVHLIEKLALDHSITDVNMTGVNRTFKW